MILKNKTKGTNLSTNLKDTKTLIDKFLGLHKKGISKSLLFNTRFGIHTFLLKKPIDVIVLDSKNVVTKTKTVKPNSIFVYNPKYSIVIELPQGTIGSSKTKIGDLLKFQK